MRWYDAIPETSALAWNDISSGSNGISSCVFLFLFFPWKIQTLFFKQLQHSSGISIKKSFNHGLWAQGLSFNQTVAGSILRQDPLHQSSSTKYNHSVPFIHGSVYWYCKNWNLPLVCFTIKHNTFIKSYLVLAWKVDTAVFVFGQSGLSRKKNIVCWR